MKKIITGLASVALALGLAGCGGNEAPQPVTTSSEVTSTTSKKATTTTSSEVATTASEPTTQPVLEETLVEEASADPVPIVEEATTDPTSVTEEAYGAPQIPPFMRPEDYDPYGPLRFVECWESNAAVMSDGSIVTDTVNCAPEPVPSQMWMYEDPPRADGCVGPAAVCGYYDEYGNPIWFDKMTGETSPRYYDEYGNPTMQRP